MTATNHPPGGAPAGHGVRSEDDVVPSVTIVKVGVGALLVFFLGSFAAVSYLRGQQALAGPTVIPPEIGESKIGLVEQQQFSLVARGERARAEQLLRLGSYGWVDRQAGVAHIPIDLAMRLVAEGVRPPGAGTLVAPAGGQP